MIYFLIFQGPVGEVGGVRLPLQSLHGYGSVFMYSASTSPGGGGGQSGGGGGEVTLRLREPEDIPEEVLARLEDTATLSISLQSDAVLRLGAAGTGNMPLLHVCLLIKHKTCAEVRLLWYRKRWLDMKVAPIDQVIPTKIAFYESTKVYESGSRLNYIDMLKFYYSN